MTIVYKRLRIRNGTLYSAFIDKELSVNYRPGEVVTPKIGKVFAFETLGYAKEWNLGSTIFKAEATDVQPLKAPLFMQHQRDIKKYIKSFWRRRYGFLVKNCKFLTPNDTPPKGTVVCSTIKLLEEVR